MFMFNLLLVESLGRFECAHVINAKKQLRRLPALPYVGVHLTDLFFKGAFFVFFFVCK